MKARDAGRSPILAAKGTQYAIRKLSQAFPDGSVDKKDFLGCSDGKESSCNKEDLSLIPGSRRSPGEGNGYPLQYSCLENSMDRGAWWATIHGIAKGRTRLSHTHTQWIRICLPMQGTRFDPWSEKIPHASEQLSLPKLSPCAATTEAQAP